MGSYRSFLRIDAVFCGTVSDMMFYQCIQMAAISNPGRNIRFVPIGGGLTGIPIRIFIGSSPNIERGDREPRLHCSSGFYNAIRLFVPDLSSTGPMKAAKESPLPT